MGNISDEVPQLQMGFLNVLRHFVEAGSKTADFLRAFHRDLLVVLAARYVFRCFFQFLDRVINGPGKENSHYRRNEKGNDCRKQEWTCQAGPYQHIAGSRPSKNKGVKFYRGSGSDSGK